jgi:2-hydroxychromene-2-carboxylate isomerase
MTVAIDFYFDFVSPYSYLAGTVLPGVAANHSAVIEYRPFTLIELMQKVGNRPTSIECQNKGIYVIADLQRWARRYQVAFVPNPAWPRIDFAELGRGALVAMDEGRVADYVAAIFRALWGDAADLGQRPRLMEVLARAKIDGEHLLQRAASPEYVARLTESTIAAADRGVFGSPTMFVGEEMFFGNDRFDFMIQALAPAASSARILR